MSFSTGDHPEELLRERAAVGILLALGAGAFVPLGSLAAAALRPDCRSRPVAFWLAGTSGCMVTGLFLEFLPRSSAVAHQYNVYGTVVVSTTVVLMAAAEVLMGEPLARLGRLQDTLTSKLEPARTPNDSKGTQLAEDFIASALALGCETGQSSSAQRVCSTQSSGNSSRALCLPQLPRADGEVMTSASQQGNYRHLRQLARRIRGVKLDTGESELDAICRMTGHSIGQADVPLDRDDFHALLLELVGTSRIRSDLIWHQLCRGSNRDWPTLAGLAAALHGQAGSGNSLEGIVHEDPTDYEVPKFMGWALQAADRLFGCDQVVDQTDASPSISPYSSTGRAVRRAMSVLGHFQSHRARLAHTVLVIRRVIPVLEALLIAIGAGVLHLIAGLSVGLVSVVNFHAGVVFAILFAVQHFSEGLLLSGDTAGSGWEKTSRCQCLFATALVGLCDCLGAGIAFAITVTRGVISNEMLAAIYFVNGGVFVQLALRKYLRAAVSFDPEKEIPTIAMIVGMMAAGAALLAR